MKRILLVLFLLIFGSINAHAQCALNASPAFTGGGNLWGRTSAQVNQYFEAKVDTNNGFACNLTLSGGTFTGSFGWQSAQIFPSLTATSSISLGVTGVNSGSAIFFNTTSGSTTLVPSTGALHTIQITIPNPTANDTFALLGTAQTYTAEQTVLLATSGAALSLGNTAGVCTHTPGASSETVTCTSDRKFKTDIQSAWWTFAIGDVWSYPIRNFIWKATGTHDIGVIAQEMQKKHPDMVHEFTTSSGSFLGVDEPNIWSLVLAIQQMMALIVIFIVIVVLALLWQAKRRADLRREIKALRHTLALSRH